MFTAPPGQPARQEISPMFLWRSLTPTAIAAAAAALTRARPAAKPVAAAAKSGAAASPDGIAKN